MTAVPFFVLVSNGSVVERVEGADPVALTGAIDRHLKGGPAAATPAAAAAVAATPAETKEQIQDRIKAGAMACRAACFASRPPTTTGAQGLVQSSDVVLFMKGTAEEPRCGFSGKARAPHLVSPLALVSLGHAAHPCRQVVKVLKELGVRFGTFDILRDEAVRQGIKEFSNWPTFPQLYVKVSAGHGAWSVERNRCRKRGRVRLSALAAIETRPCWVAASCRGSSWEAATLC